MSFVEEGTVYANSISIVRTSRSGEIHNFKCISERLKKQCLYIR